MVRYGAAKPRVTRRVVQAHIELSEYPVEGVLACCGNRIQAKERRFAKIVKPLMVGACRVFQDRQFVVLRPSIILLGCLDFLSRFLVMQTSKFQCRTKCPKTPGSMSIHLQRTYCCLESTRA